jgi:Ca2+-binding EF-hand superfamily protein
MTRTIHGTLAALALLAVLATGGRADDRKKPDAGAGTQDLVFLGDARPLLLRLHIEIDNKPFRQALDRFLDDVFTRLDTDKDGTLSKAEAARAPIAQALFGDAGGGPVRPALLRLRGQEAAMDTDRDGKVSRRELVEHYQRNGGTPFQLLQGGAATAYPGRPVPRPPGMAASGASADALNQAVLKLLDTDRDGKLSRKELAAAPAIVGKRDGDEDEMVSSAEVMGEAAQDSSPYAQVVFIDGYPGARPSGEGPFIAVTPEGARSLAAQFQKRYGGKDGKLTRQRLGLDDAAFKKLDADEDGELDAVELARFAQRPADVELVVRLGAGEGVDVAPLKGRAPPAGIKAEQGKEGQVVLDLGNTRVDLRLDRGDNRNMLVRPVNDDVLYKMQFTNADQDNNGYLDATEARGSPFFGGLFQAMDADGDGKLYLKEILAYVESTKELQTKAQNSFAALSWSDQGKGLFDLLDRNNDGRLGVRELRRAGELLDTLDQDKDGHLATTEVPRRYELRARRGNGFSGGIGPARAVAVFAGGREEPPLPENRSGPLWFRKMDRNRDGDVSLREFLGSAELFRKIDADNDGLINAVEADKADTLFRKKS